MDAVSRWRNARAAGLSADAAARAVGVSRTTLYRWAKRAEPLSRRPRRVCRPHWSPVLARAVEELRGVALSRRPLYLDRASAVFGNGEDRKVGHISQHRSTFCA
ncbi:helix-turn-helix domain-containing protein [Mesorhizobium sp.]|uniref:helix-turn-helix domain-containing protein n=1 Tax=Mesorhizobium sp. TaxID=1871066 RepID=UPI003390744A